jgi:hypothetical protein
LYFPSFFNASLFVFSHSNPPIKQMPNNLSFIVEKGMQTHDDNDDDDDDDMR